MLEPSSHPKRKRTAAVSGSANASNATPGSSVADSLTNKPPSTAPKPSRKPQPPKPPTAGEILSNVRALISGENPLTKRTEISGHVIQLLRTVMGQSPVAKKYNWLPSMIGLLLSSEHLPTRNTNSICTVLLSQNAVFSSHRNDIIKP